MSREHGPEPKRKLGDRLDVFLTKVETQPYFRNSLIICYLGLLEFIIGIGGTIKFGQAGNIPWETLSLGNTALGGVNLGWGFSRLRKQGR